MIFVYDDEFLNIKIYDDIPDIREGKPKEIIEIPDIMDAWEFYKKLVRCKECKHWRNTDAEKIPTASIACGNMHADDFCSYGQKERASDEC